MPYQKYEQKTAMATTTRTVEKGIREISTLKKDGSKLVKYQVRVHTKEMPNFSVSVDSLLVAKEILNNTKSSAGRELVATLKIRANEPQKRTKQQKYEAVMSALNGKTDEEVLSEVLNDESLKTIMLNWLHKHDKYHSVNPVDKKNIKTYFSAVQTISNTMIVDWVKQNQLVNTVPLVMRSMIATKKKRIGDISIFDLNPAAWFAYIEARLETGVAKSTVLRELTTVRSVYNHLKTLGTRYEDIVNPIGSTHTAKVKFTYQKRETRITDEVEEKLASALRSMRNQDTYLIFKLALLTGARRSEVIFWEWNNLKLDGNHYFQTRTKNSQTRKIPLTNEAKTVLNSIVRVEGRQRMFNLSLEGFKTNFQRARKSAGLEHIQFRDTRNEYISRGLLKTDNVVLIAQAAGIRNQSYFNEIHGVPHQVDKHLLGQSNSVADIQRAVGHLTPQMTQDYFRMDLEKLNEAQAELPNAYLIEQIELKMKYGQASPEDEARLLKLLMQERKQAQKE